MQPPRIRLNPSPGIHRPACHGIGAESIEQPRVNSGRPQPKSKAPSRAGNKRAFAQCFPDDKHRAQRERPLERPTGAPPRQHSQGPPPPGPHSGPALVRSMTPRSIQQRSTITRPPASRPHRTTRRESKAEPRPGLQPGGIKGTGRFAFFAAIPRMGRAVAQKCALAPLGSLFLSLAGLNAGFTTFPSARNANLWSLVERIIGHLLELRARCTNLLHEHRYVKPHSV